MLRSLKKEMQVRNHRDLIFRLLGYLHLVARKGNEDMFTVLMGFGIDMEMKDDEGNTPIVTYLVLLIILLTIYS